MCPELPMSMKCLLTLEQRLRHTPRSAWGPEVLQEKPESQPATGVQTQAEHLRRGGGFHSQIGHKETAVSVGGPSRGDQPELSTALAVVPGTREEVLCELKAKVHWGIKFPLSPREARPGSDDPRRPRGHEM